MENIGLDLHQRESQLCILTDEGEVIERRIRTTPERLTAVLGPRAPARILLEALAQSRGDQLRGGAKASRLNPTGGTPSR